MPKPRPRRRPKNVTVHSLVDLQLEQRGINSLRFKSSQLTAEISVLAPDLFRFRLARGSSFAKRPSWAVLERDWPPVPVEVTTRRRTASLRTEAGRWTVDLVQGRWELCDRSGLVLFSSRARQTAFEDGAPRLTLSLQERECIFGLGESSGTFNKRGLIREFWNIDVGGHTRAVHAHLRNMYVSIPFAISLRDGRAAGLFWDNPGRQRWDVGQTDLDGWQLAAASGEIDLYFFLGPTCGEVLERYTELTGRMPLPPDWGLGYQQCRYSYETRARVEEVAREFRRRHIPCDVIYLDIHYMDGYRVFTFGKRFPKPRQLLDKLTRQGFKVVTIVDPGVKDDRRFPVLRRGLKLNAYVKDAGGRKDYLGEVWPGRVRFPDFLNPVTRSWWGQEQARFQRLGVSGFWNDMNEPADFSAPGKDFPANCRHQTGTGEVRHAAVHNVYGSEMARASYEGALRWAPDQRPFIITRAGYAGVQRHALVWTGDNDSSWEHLADSVQMLLNLSVSGVAFCGADVGGFHHNTTGELLARWTQLAAFTPFFRNHSNIGTLDQEPWALGREVESICRHYISLRYQLWPYLYGLFLEAHRSGAPIMRPLFWHYPNDPAAVAAGDQFMLGPDLLIAPILRQGATARSVYLPPGTWFDFFTGDRWRGGRHILAEADLHRIPAYVRAGAVLPTIELQQYVGERSIKVVNLHLWPGTTGRLAWYEDDGRSLGYQKGEFHERAIVFQASKRQNRLTFSSPSGTRASTVEGWRVLLHAVGRGGKRVRCRGRVVESNLYPQHQLSVFEITNSADAFEVTWG